jgi:prephenate dehydrogenase
MTVGVVGMGLIGGSIGLALRDPARTILGYDADPAAQTLAMERGCADRIAPLAEVMQSDLVYVAVPPGVVVSVVAEAYALRGERTVVTDATSVKAAIVAWAQSERATHFVPGHPMAGHEKGTAQFASAWMFRNARWILTPGTHTNRTAVRAVEEGIKLMGANPVRLDPAVHDQSVALYSHLPHAVAGALVQMAAAQNGESVGAGSWADLTRVGGVNPALWTQIFMGNRHEIATSIRQLNERLGGLADALDASDEGAVGEFFRRAHELKNL